jgi:aminoglycoside 6'-N-acetyltransferase I
MLVRPVGPPDAKEWERMRQSLWPSAPGEHAREVVAFFAGDRRDPAEVFMAVDEQGRAVGFAETSIRSHAEGCDSDRIAYLEGWFVEEASRGRGVGAALLRAVEDWGRSQGCTELASDADVHQAGSAAAHLALGFTEVSRVVCFRKTLSGGAPGSVRQDCEEAPTATPTRGAGTG